MVVLKNEIVDFEMSLQGSAYTKFKFLDIDINPLDWKLPMERLPKTNTGSFPFQGHFLCLGTWGMPTEGEVAAGLKFYGEVNTADWKIVEPVKKGEKFQSISTTFESTIEKLDVKRTVKLYDNTSLLKIEEQITNNLPIGRPYNILQHATFGGAFINGNTILNTNAKKGFYQNADYKRSTYSDIEETSYDWPNAMMPDGEVNLSLSNQVPKSFVSSHIFLEDRTFGWATLANVQAGFLIGYIWNTKDYPWVNVWHQYEEGKVKGRAIEFATCGMWQSFEYMMTHNSRFFGKNSFEFIDAGETKEKTYYMFLLKINTDFSSVQDIELKSNTIHLKIDNNGIIKSKSITF